MRWKISHHGHDPRQIDLLAIVALLIVIVSAWTYLSNSSAPPPSAAFIERHCLSISAPLIRDNSLSIIHLDLPAQVPPPPLPPVQSPTLGIYGARDLYVTEDHMKDSARTVTGGWRYERFDDAGR